MTKIKIKKSEVLRYLGYKNQDINDELNGLIDECIEEVQDTVKPLFTYRAFKIEALNNEIRLIGCDLVLKGHDIYEHLKNSKKCVIFAASLGVAIDNRIRYLTKTHMTKSLILDSCSTEAIEGVCDLVEEQIKEIAKEEGKYTNYRFSPGYGDLSIDIQPQVLSILNTQSKIGLTYTENCILLPRKSVTAIIGFVDTVEGVTSRNCSKCNSYDKCLYRREGISCGF